MNIQEVKRFIRNLRGGAKTEVYDAMHVGGVFEMECIGSDGKLKWKDTCKNLVNNSALTTLLATMFNGATQIAQANWYLGLVSATPVPAATDTMTSHAGWTEVTNYTQATRPAWGQGAAAAQSITNATVVSFSINATVTIGGAFLVGGSSGANTKGGTGDTLFSCAAFTQGDKSCSSGDTLNVTYALNAAA
jgi:hypothetical protein